MADGSILAMRMEGQSLLNEGGGEHSAKYNSRVGRARAANLKKRQTKSNVIAFGVHDFEVDADSGTPKDGGPAPPVPSPVARQDTPVGQHSAQAPVAIEAKVVGSQPPAEVIHLLPPSHEPSTLWHWSDAAKLLAMTDHTQVLRVRLLVESAAWLGLGVGLGAPRLTTWPPESDTPGACLRFQLEVSSWTIQGPVGGCGAAVRPGRSH